jgi:hypothetical protein
VPVLTLVTFVPLSNFWFITPASIVPEMVTEDCAKAVVAASVAKAARMKNNN